MKRPLLVKNYLCHCQGRKQTTEGDTAGEVSILNNIRLLFMNPNQPLSSSPAWRKGSENLKVIKTRLLDVAMGGTIGKGHNSDFAILQGFIFHCLVPPGISL